MRTIGRHYPHDTVAAGEYQVMCAYCGAKWYRSEMRRDASGYFVCPDDDDGGRDTVTLDRSHATATPPRKTPPPEGW